MVPFHTNSSFGATTTKQLRHGVRGSQRAARVQDGRRLRQNAKAGPESEAADVEVRAAAGDKLERLGKLAKLESSKQTAKCNAF